MTTLMIFVLYLLISPKKSTVWSKQLEEAETINFLTINFVQAYVLTSVSTCINKSKTALKFDILQELF